MSAAQGVQLNIIISYAKNVFMEKNMSILPKNVQRTGHHDVKCLNTHHAIIYTCPINMTINRSKREVYLVSKNQSSNTTAHTLG